MRRKWKSKFVLLYFQSSRPPINQIRGADCTNNFRRRQTPTIRIPRSDSADVLTQQCENCIRSSQRECTKTGKGGACDLCAKRHKKCSLTEDVRAYWKSIGDPRGRSRSRSIGPRRKSRETRTDWSDKESERGGAKGKRRFRSGEIAPQENSKHNLHDELGGLFTVIISRRSRDKRQAEQCTANCGTGKCSPRCSKLGRAEKQRNYGAHAR